MLGASFVGTKGQQRVPDATGPDPASIIADILASNPDGISMAGLLAWARLRVGPDFSEDQVVAALAALVPPVTIEGGFVQPVRRPAPDPVATPPSKSSGPQSYWASQGQKPAAKPDDVTDDPVTGSTSSAGTPTYWEPPKPESPDSTDLGQYVFGFVGFGSAVALGQLWVSVLSFILPADGAFGITYLFIAIPLGLCAIGAVRLAIRRPRGSRAKPWAGGFAVGIVALLLLFVGAG
jgi:hypothetical protein